MHSIMGVLECHQFQLGICLGAQRCNQITTGREVIARGSAVLLTLSEGFDVGLSHLETEDVTLKGDYFWQVVENVI